MQAINQIFNCAEERIVLYVFRSVFGIWKRLHVCKMFNKLRGITETNVKSHSNKRHMITKVHSIPLNKL